MAGHPGHAISGSGGGAQRDHDRERRDGGVAQQQGSGLDRLTPTEAPARHVGAEAAPRTHRLGGEHRHQYERPHARRARPSRHDQQRHHRFRGRHGERGGALDTAWEPVLLERTPPPSDVHRFRRRRPRERDREDRGRERCPTVAGPDRQRDRRRDHGHERDAVRDVAPAVGEPASRSTSRCDSGWEWTPADRAAVRPRTSPNGTTMSAPASGSPEANAATATTTRVPWET